MSNTAFVLGNGESRKGIKIEDLKQHGKVYACNAVYRTENPDWLIAVDPKMLLEIAETDYVVHNKVYSNFNSAQYNRNKRILDHVTWSRPSLGWSSGPTALRLALEHKFKTIYLLGFDYKGLPDSKSNSRVKFNNVFKDTRNYKKGRDDATFFGNWMNQTKRCLNDYKDVDFTRVIPEGWFKPKDLEWHNLKHITTNDFLQKFNLTIKN
jgi:hypothetical protein|tara:strand:+ start:281 stop:907 length:627 start_codon:yes stop_codon:yes gene_type:complete